MTSTLHAPAPAAQAGTPQQRASAFIGDAMAALHSVMIKHDMTYDEYAAVKQWLIDVGKTDEWPLFLDVWFESTVEALESQRHDGTKGAIQGPFYLPGQMELSSPATVPMRDDESGDPLLFSGQVRSVSGAALPGAVVDFWQADAAGLYSGFGADAAPGNLRARVIADAEGRFEINTVRPAPYEIPKGGPCGQLLRATGWNSFRPAHLHVEVSAPGHKALISQLFFPDSPHLQDDVAGAVKQELLLQPVRTGSGFTASYDFELPSA